MKAELRHPPSPHTLTLSTPSRFFRYATTWSSASGGGGAHAGRGRDTMPGDGDATQLPSKEASGRARVAMVGG